MRKSIRQKFAYFHQLWTELANHGEASSSFVRLQFCRRSFHQLNVRNKSLDRA